MTESSTGAFATNFHSGGRSEYIAQTIFSGFGASVLVPRQEDGGWDLYATLTKEKGRLSWPLFHYTVQVKSASESLVFPHEDSVEWLIRHPLPLLLCIVDKPNQRVRIYHTFPRYLVWASNRALERVTLTPADTHEGQDTGWGEGSDFSLSAPIVDRTFSELMDAEVARHTKIVLSAWLEVDWRNLKRVSIGLPWYESPIKYKTNEPDISSGGWSFRWTATPERFAELEPMAQQLIAWIADFRCHQADVRGTAVAAMLFHDVWPNRRFGAPYPQFALNWLNIQLKMFSEERDFAAVEDLAKKFDERINWLQANGPDVQAFGQ